MKKQNKGNREAIIRRLDAVFSRYIRTRDTEKGAEVFQCITCGRVLDIEEADCGHYIPRAHMATRFDERNCHAQCRTCNRFNRGEEQAYRRAIIHRYGLETVEELEAKKYKAVKITTAELVEMIGHYEEEIKRLKRERAEL